MASRVYTRGWVDTITTVQDALKADELLSKLVTRNASIRHIKSDNVTNISAAIQVFCGARYLAWGKPQRSIEYIKSVVIGELMAPVLPEELSLIAAEADREFMFVCKYLFANETIYNRGKSGNHWIAYVTNLMDGVPAADRMPIPNPDNLTIDNCQQYLLWLAYSLPKAQYMTALQLVITCYVGAAKRGTVSERFIEKVSSGVKDDIGEDVILDATVVQTTYNIFGRYIRADNAANIFKRWVNDLPEHALRIRLTLEQVSGSGLTAFLITGRAIKKFSSFQWWKLNKLTGGELTNFIDAVRLVNGNPYFGFNRDLGIAKSTNFSTIAYVAKELLIQINGEQTLKNYQGWIKKPKSPAIIKQMLDDYIVKYNEALMSTEVTDADIYEQNTVIELVGDESNINLFA